MSQIDFNGSASFSIGKLDDIDTPSRFPESQVAGMGTRGGTIEFGGKSYSVSSVTPQKQIAVKLPGSSDQGESLSICAKLQARLDAQVISLRAERDTAMAAAAHAASGAVAFYGFADPRADSMDEFEAKHTTKDITIDEFNAKLGFSQDFCHNMDILDLGKSRIGEDLTGSPPEKRWLRFLVSDPTRLYQLDVMGRINSLCHAAKILAKPESTRSQDEKLFLDSLPKLKAERTVLAHPEQLDTVLDSFIVKNTPGMLGESSSVITAARENIKKIAVEVCNYRKVGGHNPLLDTTFEAGQAKGYAEVAFFRQTSKSGLDFFLGAGTPVVFRWTDFDKLPLNTALRPGEAWKNTYADCKCITISEMNRAQKLGLGKFHVVRIDDTTP